MSQLIVATGQTGTIGRHLNGATRGLTTRLEAPLSAKTAELKSVVADGKEFTFIHLAAMSAATLCQTDPEKAYALNVTATLEWFFAAAELGCRHFLFVSSSHVYAPPHTRAPLSIHSPLTPFSIYGKTKLAAELALEIHQLRRPSCHLTIARVFSVLADEPKPGFLQHGLTERARRADFSPIIGLDNIRDFLSAEAVATKLLQLCQSPPQTKVVNVCSGKGTTIRTIATQIFESFGHDPAKLTGMVKEGDPPYIVGKP